MVNRTKSKVLNYIYQKQKLFRFVAGKKKVVLGIQIQRVKPKTKQEWREWVDGQEIPINFARVLKSNAYKKMFQDYRQLVDSLTFADYLDYAYKIIVDDQWMGYENENIAFDYFVKKGYKVYSTTYYDDVKNGIDLQIIKDKKVGAVSVKSAGYLHSTTNEKKQKHYNQLKNLKKQKNYHKIFLVIVKKSKEIIIYKTY